MPETDRWRALFYRLEREVGARLESGVERSDFQDLVALAVHLRSRFDALGDEVATWGLHRLHLPAHRDIRELSEQMNRIERRVRDLDARLPRRRGERRKKPAT